jgi:nanoRNase/pAp phosphatase (c-di-AMP/oligoRNAs hydrolase)
MLTKKQAEEIREHLEKAQNPIFFFDNDPDGLCSFLILRKFCGKGKGVQVKSYPSMNREYFRKVNELGADYIFILDKPVVEKDFFDEVEKVNIPVVWIDHHDVQAEIPGMVHYYNPMLNKQKSNEPVTHLCYQISGRKEDMWLDVAGCISDKFVPDTYGEFKKTYPELSFDSEDAFDIFYRSQIGKIARILGFSLKDTATNVVNMLRFMIKAKGPYDVLEESKDSSEMHRRFGQIEKKYRRLFGKAMAAGQESEKMLFFKYSGDMSMSSDLSNELSYNFPGKTIVVMRINGDTASFSARGERIRERILKAIEGIPDSRGGGHEKAVGGQLHAKDIEKFKSNLNKIINLS